MLYPVACFSCFVKKIKRPRTPFGIRGRAENPRKDSIRLVTAAVCDVEGTAVSSCDDPTAGSDAHSGAAACDRVAGPGDLAPSGEIEQDPILAILRGSSPTAFARGRNDGHLYESASRDHWDCRGYTRLWLNHLAIDRETDGVLGIHSHEKLESAGGCSIATPWSTSANEGLRFGDHAWRGIAHRRRQGHGCRSSHGGGRRSLRRGSVRGSRVARHVLVHVLSESGLPLFVRDLPVDERRTTLMVFAKLIVLSSRENDGIGLDRRSGPWRSRHGTATRENDQDEKNAVLHENLRKLNYGSCDLEFLREPFSQSTRPVR